MGAEAFTTALPRQASPVGIPLRDPNLGPHGGAPIRRPTPLQQQRDDTGRDIIGRQPLRTQPDIYKDLRKAPNPYARPNLLNIFSPLPVMRGDQMGGQYRPEMTAFQEAEKEVNVYRRLAQERLARSQAEQAEIERRRLQLQAARGY